MPPSIGGGGTFTPLSRLRPAGWLAAERHDVLVRLVRRAAAPLVANNAYGWQCTSPAAAVDTTAACDLLYHVTDAVSRFAVFSSPYFWQCWN